MTQGKRKTWVIGHKNPDTDSICAAIAYAELKNQTVEYSKLSEEEIEQIIFERYLDKDEKTKTFLRKALKVHGNRYDYSKTIYVKAREKVEIICKVEGHSSFWQTPEHHLRGRGCQICGGSKRLTLEEFIEKSNLIQGKGRYDYSESEYINNRTLIKIICPKTITFLLALLCRICNSTPCLK